MVDVTTPPAPVMSKEMADKATKAAADKEAADAVNAAKVLGDMELAVGNKLRKMHEEMGAEFGKAHAAYYDMPSEITSHAAYKTLGEKFASVEALLNTLKITADIFPAPGETVAHSADPHWKGPAHLEEPHIEGTMGTPPAPPVPMPSVPPPSPLNPVPVPEKAK